MVKHWKKVHPKTAVLFTPFLIDSGTPQSPRPFPSDRGVLTPPIIGVFTILLWRGFRADRGSRYGDGSSPVGFRNKVSETETNYEISVQFLYVLCTKFTVSDDI